MEFSTRTIHAGQPSDPETGSLIAPIFQTSTTSRRSRASIAASTTRAPTTRRARGSKRCSPISKACDHAAAFASGLAAENAVLQAYLKPGDEIIIPLDVYGGTYRILNQGLRADRAASSGRSTSRDHARARGALSDRTRLVWIESPTNPRLLVYDIAEICAAAHASGALVVVDNTFATPFFQQPFQLGADIVVHSVTKYLAGTLGPDPGRGARAATPRCSNRSSSSRTRPARCRRHSTAG